MLCTELEGGFLNPRKSPSLRPCIVFIYIIAHACTADLIIVSSLRAVCYRSLKVIYSETSYPGTHTYGHLKDTTIKRLNFVNPMNVAYENRKKKLNYQNSKSNNALMIDSTIHDNWKSIRYLQWCTIPLKLSV